MSTAIELASRMNSLLELLQEQLRDLYDAEIQYRSKLPDMVSRATDPVLADALADISNSTSATVEAIEDACSEMDVVPTGVTCEAMRGLIREASETVRERGDTATMDATLIANAQRIAHYEIAGFGTTAEFARCLKLTRPAEILSNLTRTAKEHDRTLSKIANGGWFKSGINHEAAASA